MSKTLMADPLGGDDRDLGAPTTIVGDVNGRPLGGDAGSQERPPPILKTLMVGPLGGNVGDPRAPTTYVKDIDGGPPRR
jgi:hypothetical protein